MEPSTKRTATARDRAAEVLTLAYHGEVIAHEVLASLQAESPLSPADERLAAELVLGVLRRRLTCEHIASRFYRGRWAGLREAQRVVLAMGVYQLCMLDRVPDHAAVDQTVRQAKRLGRGFGDIANAVLRRVASYRGDIVPAQEAGRPIAAGDPSHPSPIGDVSGRPSAGHNPRRWLALDGGRGRIFTEDILPDPDRRPLEYLIAATGTPAWLVERWHRRFKPKLARQVCDAGWRRPVLALRPNRLRTTPAALCERLSADGFSPELIESGTGFQSTSSTQDIGTVIVRDGPPAMSLGVIAEGLCQPQDATAQVALNLAQLEPGMFVIDLCAGVGTKSTQAAELMDDAGCILATDLHLEKLAQIEAGARRLGIGSIRTVPLDELDAAIARVGRAPDVLLLDVPCLNTGVLARRPEARYRAGQKALRSVCEAQAAILARAASLACKATRIVYATCSLEPEENESQVEGFLRANSGWRRAAERSTLPGELHDGGYAALILPD